MAPQDTIRISRGTEVAFYNLGNRNIIRQIIIRVGVVCREYEPSDTETPRGRRD
jgi:hypothetical protein